jgi:hypothetical protein
MALVLELAWRILMRKARSIQMKQEFQSVAIIKMACHSILSHALLNNECRWQVDAIMPNSNKINKQSFHQFGSVRSGVGVGEIRVRFLV